jgi:AcrR family transcriptional regulator
LSDEQIVLAALELVRRRGAEKLSMRQRAKHFDVTPMAIYHYSDNKESLFERLGPCSRASRGLRRRACTRDRS